MSQGDLAVIGSGAFMIVILVIRRVVQADRGQPFTRDELTLVVASLVFIGVGFVVYRSPTLVTWVPSVVFLASGVYLYWTQRANTQSSRQFRLMGLAAIVLGASAFVVPLLFRLLGG